MAIHLFLENAQHHGFPIGWRQAMHQIIQQRAQVVPGGSRFGGGVVHGMCGLFAEHAALLRPLVSGGDVTRSRVQPAGKRPVPGQPPGLPGQLNKHGLGHLLGPVMIPGHLSPGGRMHQIQMPPDQLGEGRLRAVGSKLAEPLRVVLHRDFQK